MAPNQRSAASFDGQFPGKYYEGKSPRRMRQSLGDNFEIRQGVMQDMLISDRTVERIMGPEPIPTLDIEMSEIQNEL